MSVQEPAVRKRFTHVTGERIDDGVYHLHGLPEGADFRDESEYETVKCGWLKVEGVGFSANTFEFSEHQTYVVIEQQNAGGGTHISFEEM